MNRVKNFKARCLAMVLTVCMLISAFSTLASALSWTDPGETIYVDYTKYDITINYVDDTGKQIDDSETKTDAIVGAGKTYDEAAKSIDGYTYVGYYVLGVGDINNLGTGNLFVQTSDKGEDSTDGRGAYTLVAVYSVDKNENEIPDPKENYDVTEKFVDKDGNSLASDNSVAIKGGVEYYGTVKDIAGYDYVGYYYQGTYTSDSVNLADGAGSLVSPIASDPYVLMRSEKGYGTYDVTLVYQKSANWVTVTFDANKGTGSMEPLSVIEDVPTKLTENGFSRQGYTFAGWSTDASAETPDYLDEDYITTNTNVTLYAVWDVDLSQWSKITFHINDGSGVDDTYDQLVITGVEDTLKLNKFENLGYVFVGWSTSASSSEVKYNDGDKITVTGNTDLYAVWKYDAGQWSTINYHSNTADNETIPEVVLTGYATTLRANTFKNPGYKFAGWSTDGSDTVAYKDGASVMVTGNMDLYAVWEYDSSQWTKVVFHINDESGVDTIREQPVIIGIDQTLDTNTFFDRPGYDFKGWSTSASSSTVSYLDGATINVSGETHLYAVWEYNSYLWATITFHSNDGTGETKTQEVVKGQATPLDGNTFIYTGYAFVGWSTDGSDTPAYGDTGIVVATEDMDLYAIWTEDASQRVTITYHINDTSGVDTIYPQTVIKNVPQKLTKNEFVRPGYLFKGWSETATGSAKYEDEDTVTISDDLHLYAVWEKDPSQWATITFHINDGSGTDEIRTQEVIKNVATPLDENKFVRAGYTFTAWSTSASSSTISYLNGGTITVSEDTDLYALWSYDPSQWATITFHINDESGTDTTYTQNVLKGVDQKLDSNEFTRSGYLFAGWSTSATGSATLGDEAVVNVSIDTDLYAKWNKDPNQWATIVFDANNGSGDQKTQEVLIGSLTNLYANEFSYAGYAFVGWSTSPNSNTIQYADKAYIIPSGNIVLYAVWRVDLSQWATITYNINNDTTGNFTTYTQSVIKGVATELVENKFTYYGYKLSGWSTDGSKNVAYNDGATVTIYDDLDLYAVWVINEDDWATITFDANGGTGTMDPIKVLKGTSIVLLTANEFERVDYIFCGWSLSGEADTLSDIVYDDKDAVLSVDQNITLYAVWGTPDANRVTLYAQQDASHINTIVDWVGELEVKASSNSTPLYNTILYITIPTNQVSYIEGSLKITSNTGSIVLSASTYENGILAVYLGQIDPGTKYTISLQTLINVDNQSIGLPTNLYGTEYK